MGTMTKTEIAKRKVVNYYADMDRIEAERREAGKRYFEAEKDSKAEIIAWGDLQWATNKLNALKERGIR